MLTDGPVTAKAWFDALKSSRSFITNWMSADVAVNGDRRAVEYNIRSGEPVTVVAVVKVNPDFDQLDRVELVGHGEILHAESAGEASSELKLTYSFLPSSSLWLAIRAYGRNGALLHTAPIYIYLDGDRAFANRAKVADLARKYRDILTKFRNSTPSLSDDFERFEVNDLILPGWQEAKPRIDAA
jgi:hypothetical protein